MKQLIRTLCMIAIASIPVLASAQVTARCPVITDYLKRGGQNNPDQVRHLQAFLNDFQHAGIQVSGTFDEATENAVKAFQRTYASEILAPFGATKPSGFVHITTLKKINQIACGGQMSLDSNELSTINSIKNRGNSLTQTTISSNVTIGQAEAPDAPVVPEAPAASSTGNVDQSNADMAADPLMSRFGRFIVNLFK
jgi:peptidoglycan hydrolase-like protein with peptidoglycan-binding domain